MLSNVNNLKITYSLSDLNIAGEGNLSNRNPFFSNELNYDYRLQQTSPCINAGNPSPEYADLDGTITDMGYIYYNQCGIIQNILTISCKLNSNSTRRAAISIKSTEEINGLKVLYTAGDSIVLKSGFSVLPGSEFTARITSCITSSRKVNLKSDNLDFNENPNQVQISVFPNPASDWLNVEYQLSKDGMVQLQLFDLKGRPITTYYIQEFQQRGQYIREINLHNLSSGIYLLNLLIENQLIGTQRIIVKK